MNNKDMFWEETENRLVDDLKKLLQSNATDFLNLPSLKGLDEKTVQSIKTGVIAKLDSLKLP